MIDRIYFWTVILFLGLGTMAIRFSLIALSSRLKISERHKEILSFIPCAILPALMTPMAFFHQGSVEWIYGKERFLILVLSSAVCFWTKNMLATIFFGLTVLYLIT